MRKKCEFYEIVTNVSPQKLCSSDFKTVVTRVSPPKLYNSDSTPDL